MMAFVGWAVVYTVVLKKLGAWAVRAWAFPHGNGRSRYGDSN
jgi:hypothetical protein